MFGSPTILVTIPETCKQVLMDDSNFVPGWPKATEELIGKKSFLLITPEEHRWLRKVTAAPVNGHEMLSNYLKFIEASVISSLESWAQLGEIEFLTELRRLTFRIIMHIFLSLEGETTMVALEKVYTALNKGIRAMAINFPGFAYYYALKARKTLVAVMQRTIDERKEVRRSRGHESSTLRKDMLDSLMDVQDENGRHLADDEIIDTLIMYLNAGHESSGHITMWATLLLQQNPLAFQKAKEEQEEILRRRPPNQKGLSLQETREMVYLSKVIDETLRVVNISFVVFRQAVNDVMINGYIVPKGWKTQVWLRNVHMDPKVYHEPGTFNPSRWDDYTPKAGSFIPFSAGSRLCPGNDLAKLEISVFLHYFLLDYQLERVNPDCAVNYLPHPRPKDNCLARIQKIRRSP
ncbi:ent-kaurenoic acid oxidase 2 isoform X2 [Amborella trichopoda]|nr:ent-kaurenoic acid oxidase 2 isoform X2 [Amborella trichopoda]|eukprot:XP_020524803.1 ent-kaurenoic acid oxidase 2 isoform X2 [Amborella trichopoda]